MLRVIHPSREPVKQPRQALVSFVPEAPAAQLTTHEQLNKLFESRKMGHIVRSHWAAYPTLRSAAAQLYEIIGHQWRRGEQDAPLIVEAIELGTENAVRVVQEEGAGARHVVCTYLAAMTDAACDVVDVATVGTKGGRSYSWQPFGQSFPDWCSEHRLERVEVFAVEITSPAVRDGLRAGLITKIATAEEAGLVMRSYF